MENRKAQVPRTNTVIFGEMIDYGQLTNNI